MPKVSGRLRGQPHKASATPLAQGLPSSSAVVVSSAVGSRSVPAVVPSTLSYLPFLLRLWRFPQPRICPLVSCCVWYTSRFRPSWRLHSHRLPWCCLLPGHWFHSCLLSNHLRPLWCLVLPRCHWFSLLASHQPWLCHLR